MTASRISNGACLAAIDIGSNSFRLEVGRVVAGNRIERVAYLKEIIRQGKALDAAGNLSQDAMERGWACLERFGAELRRLRPQQVRAVATATLRDANNRAAFVQRGSALLGAPIEVISGLEEARLIFQGVVRMLPTSDERRLVVDIGGRSTELILGQRYVASILESYSVGSVAWSMQFFPDGAFTPQRFSEGEAAARLALAEVAGRFTQPAWEVAYGASGTVGAVADALTAAGWEKDVITPDGLHWLRQQVLAAGRVDRLQLAGVKDDRRSVIGGGLCVMQALFDLLQIPRLVAADGALRQGVLYEFLL